MRTALTASLLMLCVPAIAQAQDANAAEKERLLAEMERLAQRNQWAGVDSAYAKAERLGGELFFEAHVLGAQAARTLGDPWTAVLRLRKAKAITYDAQVVSDLQLLESTFGKVWITINGKKRPPLEPAQMPFAPDQRAAVEWAQAQLGAAGAFRGMVPSGTYTIGDQSFEVIVGEGNFLRIEVDSDAAPAVAAVEPEPTPAPEPQAVPEPEPEPEPEPAPAVAEAPPPRAKDPAPRRPPPDKIERPSREPTSITVGPLVMLGGGFVMSPPPPPGTDITAIQPGPSGWGGLNITAGAELSAGLLGGAVAIVGSPGFGNSYFHQVGGWAALVLRPGPLHIAAGPTFTYLWGEGTGVADWFDRGQDRNLIPNTDIEWEGSATAMGVRLELGVAPFDLGPFQALVSLGGTYQNDSVRNYLGGGLNLGIVPKI